MHKMIGIFLLTLSCTALADTPLLTAVEFESEYRERGYSVDDKYLNELVAELENRRVNAVLIIRAKLLKIDDQGRFHFQREPGQSKPDPTKIIQSSSGVELPSVLPDKAVMGDYEIIGPTVMHVEREAIENAVVDVFEVHTTNEQSGFVLSHWGVIGFRLVQDTD